MQLFAALAPAFGRPGQNGGPGHNGGPGGSHHGGGNQGQWVSELCANATLAQAFLTQTQQLIATLTTNASFTQFLQQHTQATAYIQNAANGNLLSSNCTGYFSGLQAAKSLDQQAAQAQQQYQQIAVQAFFQIIQSLVGGNGGNGDSSGESAGL